MTTLLGTRKSHKETVTQKDDASSPMGRLAESVWRERARLQENLQWLLVVAPERVFLQGHTSWGTDLQAELRSLVLHERNQVLDLAASENSKWDVSLANEFWFKWPDDAAQFLIPHRRYDHIPLLRNADAPLHKWARQLLAFRQWVGCPPARVHLRPILWLKEKRR